MRRLDLFVNEQESDFAEGLNSSAPAYISPMVVGDTILLASRKVAKNATPGATVFAEKPWDALDFRASLGLIDTAPDTGTFKLKVAAETTTAITWPGADATEGEITTFRAAALAALKALPGVLDTDIVASDPPASPGHYLYFTWTGVADERAIEVVSSTLAPLVLPKVEVQRAAPGYQQLIRLSQAPIVETIDFELVDFTPPAISNQRIGQILSNAVQRITIAEKSIGSISLKWSGVPTRLLPVPGVTAALLALALNAIVTDGESNPSFQVTQVRGGLATFDIEFIGPLAGAPQALLEATLYPSVPPTVAVATLKLTKGQFSRILAGQRQAPIDFEFVYRGADGDEATIIRSILIKRDMTDGNTPAELEALGAVLVQENTVYVDNGLGVPFVQAAYGAAYTIPGAVIAGAAIVVPHGQGTFNPRVFMQYESSLDPEEWRDLAPFGEFDWKSTTANHITITCPFAITDLAGDEHDRNRYRIFVGSPAATLGIFDHRHTWADILKTLPDGMSVEDKFAAIDAALGILGGTLMINVSNITGLLPPANIDIAALVKAILAALAGSPELIAKFIEVVTNSDVIKAIIAIFQTTSEFDDLIKHVFENAEVIQKLIEEEKKNSTFLEELRDVVLSIFTSAPTASDALMFRAIPNFEITIPPPLLLPGPSAVRTVPVTETTEIGGPTTVSGTTAGTGGGAFSTASGGTQKSTVTIVRQIEETYQTRVRVFAPLSPALDLVDDGDQVTGLLTSELGETLAGKVCTVIAAAATAEAVEGRDTVTFAVGAKVTYAAAHWYQVQQAGRPQVTVVEMTPQDDFGDTAGRFCLIAIDANTIADFYCFVSGVGAAGSGDIHIPVIYANSATVLQRTQAICDAANASGYFTAEVINADDSIGFAKISTIALGAFADSIGDPEPDLTPTTFPGASGDTWFASECENILFTVNQTEVIFGRGSRWNISFAPSFLLEGRAQGRTELVIEQASVDSGTLSKGNLLALDWEEIERTEILLSDAPTTHRFAVQIDHTLSADEAPVDVYGGKLFRYGVAKNFVGIGGSMAVRARVANFDVQDTEDYLGAFTVSMRAATDAVITIPS